MDKYQYIGYYFNIIAINDNILIIKDSNALLSSIFRNGISRSLECRFKAL